MIRRKSIAIAVSLALKPRDLEMFKPWVNVKATDEQIKAIAEDFRQKCREAIRKSF